MDNLKVINHKYKWRPIARSGGYSNVHTQLPNPFSEDGCWAPPWNPVAVISVSRVSSGWRLHLRIGPDLYRISKKGPKPKPVASSPQRLWACVRENPRPHCEIHHSLATPLGIEKLIPVFVIYHFSIILASLCCIVASRHLHTLVRMP